MSFSADWLALREPVDHRSIAADVRDRAVAALAGRESVEIVDLGCGSGSNLRALADHIAAPVQRWTLVDWDEVLLAHARARLAAWGERARDEGDALVIHRGARRIEVRVLQADLARHVEHALERPADLVTAAAFFDLVSEDWMGGFCAALAARRAPLYTTLTYNGHERWSPPHAADADILAAFHAHQHSDKGFGPAAGPRAAAALERALRAVGYGVASAASPWSMDASDRVLMSELARGAASAVRETGRVPEAAIDDWLDARLAASACEIGHEDIFAAPA
jgi:SAM-dependent methyltransferase